MIQEESMLDVADNTGAKKVLWIRVLGGSKKRYASVASKIICVVKKASSKGSVKKSDIVTAVVVRTKNKIMRKDGTVVKFDKNAVVIVNNDGNPKGTRIFGAIPRELRDENYMKIISLASEVI